MKTDEFIKRKNWILTYILENCPIGVDVLNEAFVDAYIDEFNAKYKLRLYGANSCNELSTMLSELYKQGELSREVCGVANMGSGFPKWVYVYNLQ